MNSEAANYFEHPLYNQAMDAFQRGKWEDGKTQLGELIELYPLAPELRTLNQEMQLRSQIDRYERDENNQARRGRITRFITRAGLIVAVLVLVVIGVRTYSSWVGSQVTAAREALEAQAVQVELTVKLNNARSLIAANRPQEAQQLVDQIVATDPNFPNVADVQSQLDRLQTVEGRYNEAVALIDQENNVAALAILREIQVENPGFRNVPQLIENLERNSFLDEQYTEGNIAYQSGNWEEAISSYDRIRSIDPQFQTEAIEARLFQSYINAGEALLTKPEATIDDFEKASTYFRSALALRPQDPTAVSKQTEAETIYADLQIAEYINQAAVIIQEGGDSLTAFETAEDLFKEALRLRPNDAELKLKVDMARQYLTAMQEFEKGNWPVVIGNLTTVYQEDPNYAAGTARQALFDALISYGDQWVAIGDYTSALPIYTQAAQIAQTTTNLPMLIGAQIKVAETRGRLGEYEDAVRLYEDVVDQIEIDLADRLDNQRLSVALSQAENYALARNFRSAYDSYRTALQDTSVLFTLIEYRVEEGDHIASLANRFNTTVEAIASANQIENPNKVLSGQVLIIPSAGEGAEVTPTPTP